MKNTNKRRRKNPALNRTRKVRGGYKMCNGRRYHDDAVVPNCKSNSNKSTTETPQKTSTITYQNNVGFVTGDNLGHRTVKSVQGKKMRGFDRSAAQYLNENGKLPTMENNDTQQNIPSQTRRKRSNPPEEPSACTIM